jgi:hypothetical protein
MLNRNSLLFIYSLSLSLQFKARRRTIWFISRNLVDNST